VQSTLAPSYALSFAAGAVVMTNSSDTLADGMATRVPDADALAIIRKGASRIVQVTDDEVAAAIRAYWTDTHNLAEGAGAAPLAAALQDKARLSGKRVGLILSGGNIDFDLFRRWVVGETVSGGGCWCEQQGPSCRACPGHPRLAAETRKTWMPGTRPGMTNER